LLLCFALLCFDRISEICHVQPTAQGCVTAEVVVTPCRRRPCLERRTTYPAPQPRQRVSGRRVSLAVGVDNSDKLGSGRGSRFGALRAAQQHRPALPVTLTDTVGEGASSPACKVWLHPQAALQLHPWANLSAAARRRSARSAGWCLVRTGWCNVVTSAATVTACVVCPLGHSCPPIPHHTST
jgi:hypothetical protein